VKSKYLLIVTCCIFLFVGCSQTAISHPYDLEGVEGYTEDFLYTYKLPTGLPFEVKGINIMEMGERDAPPNAYSIELALYGENIKDEHVWIRIVDFGNIENRSGKNEQRLQLGDGREAKYFNNGSAQTLAWDDEDLMYNITIALEDDEKEKYTIEELVKIADSFEPYQ
jgi:hypothetical protein